MPLDECYTLVTLRHVLTPDEYLTLVQLRIKNRQADLAPLERRELNALEARITEISWPK